MVIPLSRSVASRGIGQVMGASRIQEPGAPAQTGPLRYGIVGQAPEYRTHTPSHRHQITSIPE